MSSGTGRIGLCESQPVTAEGVRAALSEVPDLSCHWSVNSLPLAGQLMAREQVDMMLVDKSFGITAILGLLHDLRLVGGPRTIVWGTTLTESEALRLLQAGARGILRKSTDEGRLLACFRAVAEGNTYMDEGLFQDLAGADKTRSSELTARERQVLELVEEGKKNREIAEELGIRPGTVKIHLRHIFEKTGVRGRYSLAFTGIRERSAGLPPTPPKAPILLTPGVAASA